MKNAIKLRHSRIEKAVAALKAAGWTVHSSVSGYWVAITDEGEDDPGAVDTLREVRAILRPFRCTARWTGNGNTDGCGVSTSDARIEQYQS